MIIEVENKKAGKSKAIGMPIKFSKTKIENALGAPVFGEHTDEVLQNFGYSDTEIKDYKTRGNYSLVF